MIDSKYKVNLGGLLQKIHVKGEDENNPILLFLHGGPGVSNRHAVMADPWGLAKDFIIVGWDQRGTAGSYKGCNMDTLSIDRLVKDAKELIDFLCEKYHKEKVYVIGGSWGSMLGTFLTNRYPEKIGAFVGFGQVVNIAQNEEISYDFALKQALEANDTKSVEALKQVGPPVGGIYKGGYDGMMVQRNIMMKYGGYSKDENKRSYLKATVIPVLTSGEYTFKEILGYIKGYKKVLIKMWPELGGVDFKKNCTKFAVPVYILDGTLDMNTPAQLVEDWYNMIEAPDKQLIWFEKSGHNPMGDEPELFGQTLRKLLLNR